MWIFNTGMTTLCIALLITTVLIGFVSSSGVPDPSTFPYSQRFSLYSWGGNYTEYCNPCGTPQQAASGYLLWSAGLVTQVGFSTIRVYFSGSNYFPANYKNWNSVTSPSILAINDPYKSLFDSPNFSTYLLTLGDWGPTDIQALATVLLTNYGNTTKTFIFLNWEQDNHFCSDGTCGGSSTGTPVTKATLDNYIVQQNQKAAAVVSARAAVSNSQAKVFSGIEFNLVRWTPKACVVNATNDCLCNTDTRLCVISYAAPKINVDYYSYSSWQTLYPSWETILGQNLIRDMNIALNWVQTLRPTITQANFLVGEYGFWRSGYTIIQQASEVNITATAMVNWGASYINYWQVIDNQGSSNVPYGAFLPPAQVNGPLSLSAGGVALQTIASNDGLFTCKAGVTTIATSLGNGGCKPCSLPGSNKFVTGLCNVTSDTVISSCATSIPSTIPKGYVSQSCISGNAVTLGSNSIACASGFTGMATLSGTTFSGCKSAAFNSDTGSSTVSLDAGTITGVVVGVIVGFVLLIVGVVVYRRINRQNVSFGRRV